MYVILSSTIDTFQNVQSFNNIIYVCTNQELAINHLTQKMHSLKIKLEKRFENSLILNNNLLGVNDENFIEFYYKHPTNKNIYYLRIDSKKL